MLDTALWYAKKMGWAVFPLASNNNVPNSGTKGFLDASKDPEVIKAMFSKFPSSNVGIATGEISNLFVVDVDVKKGGIGEESLEYLEDCYGKLPTTIEAYTPSGGRHLFFQYPDGHEIKSKTNYIAKNIDTRANGGYVVASPSTTPKGIYEWEVEQRPSEMKVAIAPDWLISLAEEKISSPDEHTRFKLPNGLIPQGTQDETLFKYACSLRQHNKTEKEVESLLWECVDQKCEQDPARPFTQRDIDRWIKGAWKYPLNEQVLVAEMFGDNSSTLSGPYNDLWNAGAFYKLFGKNLAYCSRMGGWYIWDGKRWSRDETNLIQSMAIDTVKKIPKLIGGDLDKSIIRHIKSSGSNSSIKGMISLLSSHRTIAKCVKDFDNDAFLFNLQNGTYDLKKNELLPHNRSNMITKTSNVVYDPDAKCPLWDKFLDHIFLGRKGLVDYMQRIIGYSLTDSTKEQACFFFHGFGNNGKSTLVNVIEAIMGDYTKTVPANTLMSKKNNGIPNDIASLVGSRLVTSKETEQNRALDENTVKYLTGDDKISVRFLHKEFFEFIPTFKIFLATNNKPDIHGTDKAIWRRIKMIPFDLNLEEDQKDMDLGAKLKTELSGILNWAIRGCKIWQDKGLDCPAEVLIATNEYRNDEDIFGEFFSECLQITKRDDDMLPINDILPNFQVWCKQTGQEYKGKFINKKQVKDWIMGRNIKLDKSKKSQYRDKMVFFGLTVKADVPIRWGEVDQNVPF